MRTYTEQELIAFGNAMLSKPNDENRQSGVTDADVANFNEKLEKIDGIMEVVNNICKILADSREALQNIDILKRYNKNNL